VKPATKFRIPKKKRLDSESNNLVIVCKEEPSSDSEPELRIAENEIEIETDETPNGDDQKQSDQLVKTSDPAKEFSNIKGEPESEVEKTLLNLKSTNVKSKQLKVEVASDIPLIKEELVDEEGLLEFLFRKNLFFLSLQFQTVKSKKYFNSVMLF
jgi:hypothetical protein